MRTLRTETQNKGFVRIQSGYFFDSIFEPKTDDLSDLEPTRIAEAVEAFLSSYNPDDSQEIWLEKMRKGAELVGMHMRDYARVLRVKLTGKNRTPDLYAIMQVMGQDRVRSRLS